MQRRRPSYEIAPLIPTRLLSIIDFISNIHPSRLHPFLLLLMTRLNDDEDDDGVVADFCACFHSEKRAVLAAIRGYRHASRTVH